MTACPQPLFQVLGEKLVLEANGRGGLATVALRPSGIFGEGDPLLVPKLISRARAGKMKFIVGNGTSLMDWTYVGNVAQAHLEASTGGKVDSRVRVRRGEDMGGLSPIFIILVL